MRAEEHQDNHISDWLLERYRLEELKPAQKSRVEKALQTNPELKQRLAGLAQSDLDILNKYPVNNTARLIRAKQSLIIELKEVKKSKPHPWYFYWLPAGLTLSAAIVICLFLVIMPRMFSAEEQTQWWYNQGINRVKGLQTGLHIYKQQGNQAVLLKSGFKAKAQDVLQLGFVAAENYYGVILSLDGNGLVTLHFPEDYKQEHADGAPFIKMQGEEILLPYSYKLDTAPLFERFFLVTSEKGFKVSEVLAAARKLYALGHLTAMHQPLALPEEFKQHSCLLIKESDK